MKRVLILFVFLYAITSLGNISEPEIVEIRIHYQSSFSSFPEMYQINMLERKVEIIRPKDTLPADYEIVKTKKIRGKKWKKLIAIIDQLDINSMNSSGKKGIEGDSYSSLSILYSNRGKKELKMWTGYTSDELMELYQLIKFRKYKE